MPIDPKTVVLIADTSRNMRKIVRSILHDRGVKSVLECDDGVRAWDLINDRGVNVVICEWKMPMLSGLELLEKIRWSEEFSHIPFIMATGTSDENKIKQAIEAEVSDYVVKPFTADVLLYKLERVLAGHRLGGPAPVEEPGEAGPSREELSEIIKNKRVKTSFQPILSLDHRTVAGFEALTRGGLGKEGVEIAPKILFPAAEKAGLSTALDMVCRRRSLEMFANLYRKKPGIFLSLNISSSNIEEGVDFLDDVVEGAEELGIEPRHICLELVADDGLGMSALESFFANHREEGFRLAFDRVGATSLNFDRILKLKPDMVKLDRNVIADLDKEHHKLDTVRAVINMARKVGAEVTATGVEREEEAVALMDLGVYSLQGFYFDRPLKKDVSGYEKYLYQVEYLSYKFDQYALARIKGKRERNAGVSQLLKQLAGDLSKTGPKGFYKVLEKNAARYESVLGGFVLNGKGVQITKPFHKCPDGDTNCLDNLKGRGERHNLTDYYMHIKAGYAKFVTEAQVHPAFGLPTQTMAQRFSGGDGKVYVLCLDVVGM